MKAIFTHWALSDKTDSAGFNTTKDLATTLALSVEYAKKHFYSVELVTNKRGKELLIDKYKIGFTSVDTSLEDLKLHPDLWAFSKIKSYSLQKQPFVSIDLDAILWQKIPRNILKAAVFFQNEETFDKQPGYKYLVQAISNTTVAYFCRRLQTSSAYNCGIVGVKNLNLVKEWYKIAEDLIFNPANKHFWDNMANKSQMNYLFEQYFIACVCKNEGVVDDVKFLVDDLDYKNVSKPKIKFTHLWGDSKRKESELSKIRSRLKKEFPRIYNRINSIPLDPKETFKAIYDKGTAKYTKMLNKCLVDNKITSIVYLGYDNMKSSKYISSAGEDIDFVYSNTTKNSFPECDLLIIKDAVLQWSGKEYIEFCSKKISAKFIMNGKSVFRNQSL